MKLAVFTLKTESGCTNSDEDLLEILMNIVEAFGCAVIGELTYEDIVEENKDVQKV